MKKRILFILPYLECGGVESTFISLLNAIDRAKYECTLLLLQNKGEFKNRIPNDVTIKFIKIPDSEIGIFFGKKDYFKKILHSGKLWRIPSFLKHNSQYSITENRENNAKYFDSINSSIPKMNDEYDLAVDYFGYASFTTFYIAEKVNAKVKVSWLHSILSRFEPYAFCKWYREIDHFFAVSEMVKKDFQSMFPEFNNVSVFRNIIDPEVIRSKANQGVGFDDGFSGTRILTVGRICEEKGQDLAVEALHRLLTDNYDVKWYFIGNGSSELINTLKESIPDAERDRICFLGTKNNPYTYMKQCDIYVQPSRFEGYCTTTNEARILGCPVVTTDVSGAKEQFVTEETGLIVESSSNGLYTGVKRMMNDSCLKEQFKRNLNKCDFTTSSEVQELYSYLR